MNFKRTLSLALVFILLCTVQCISAFGAEVTSEQAMLLGSFNNWEGEEMELADGSVYNITVDLEAGNYLFKIKCGDTEFGHPGTVKDTTANVSSSGFLLSDSINAKCTLVATGGSYTFSFDADTYMLKVIKDGNDTEDTSGDTLKINYADTEASAQVGDTATFSIYLSSDKLFEDIQSILNYNSRKLSLKKVTSENAEITDAQAEALRYCPNISDAIYNSEHSGAVAVNASDINGYDFTNEKVLLTLDFEVIEGGETALEFIIQEMTSVDGTAYYEYSNKVCEGAVIREEVTVTESDSIPVNSVAGVTVTLESDIALNLFVKLSDDVVNDEKARVVFTLPNGTKKSVYVKNITPNDDGLYVFTCKVAAKEMASDVKARLVTSAFNGDEFVYSVKAYGEEILKGTEVDYEKAKPLVKAMLNYGAYAQSYFGYNTDVLANESLSEDDKALTDIDLSGYKYKLSGEEQGVKYYGSKLSLESETAIKHYYYIEDEENIPTITVNGIDATAKKTGDFYEVKIKGILAQNLDAPVVVKVGNLTLDYNALSYAELSMKTTDTNLKNVMKALCIYNAEADAYIN